MKPALLLALACAACATPSAGGKGPGQAIRLPADVRAFVARRASCDHFRGEGADDPTRAAEIDAKLTQLCIGSDAELARLKRVHARDGRVVRTLSRYDSRIE
jgi:hypothetical protein